jgi:predicted nucleic acid-binding protein
MVLVDSSVWIEALRGRGRLEIKLAVEGLLEVDEAQWCTPGRLEVLGGARQNERDLLGQHFSTIPCRECGGQDWDRAISLASKLRSNELTITWLDILVAAIALHDGTRLFAIGDHFKKIQELTGLVLYEPGHGGMFRPE